MRNLLFILLAFLSAGAFAQSANQVHMVTESSAYVSGDMVRLQLMVMDASGRPVTEDRIIHTFLTDHRGTVVLKRKFLVTDIEKAGFIQLPADLETGKYTLVACIAGADTRARLSLSVYNPSIFASSIPPDNADTGLGLESSLPAANLTLRPEGALNVSSMANLAIELPKTANKGVMLTKIYDPRFETAPVMSEITESPVPEAIEDKLSFEYITTDPNSRISLYFMEQGFVEEFYLAEEEKILEKLPALFGSGHIYAYQFDAQGNRLGELPVKVEPATRISFATSDNTVPFNDEIRQILEKKRVRKFVDQVYRNGEDPVVSLMAEEYNMNPDRTVVLSNFSGIASLREALSNITPKTQVIRRDKEYELRLSPENSGFRYQESPLILMEGVPTFSLDSLIEMPSEDIESIEVFISLDKLRRFGTFGRYGVVSIHLTKPEENPLQEKLDKIPVYYGVSDLVSEPVSVDGPDLRPVAFWDPALRLSGQEEIMIRWNPSDVAGEYIAWSLVVGADGRILKSARTIEVSSN